MQNDYNGNKVLIINMGGKTTELVTFIGKNIASNSIFYVNGGNVDIDEFNLSGVEVGKAAFVIEPVEELLLINFLLAFFFISGIISLWGWIVLFEFKFKIVE